MNGLNLPRWGASGMLALALCALAGCGGGGTPAAVEDDADTQAAPIIASKEEVLNSFVVADQELTFLRHSTGTEADEDDAILSLQVVSKIDHTDYVASLQASQGPLTFLELFQALAPEGQAAHPALLKSHRHEALAFGRADAAVKPLAKIAPLPAQFQAGAVPAAVCGGPLLPPCPVVPPPSCGTPGGAPCPPIPVVCEGLLSSFTADQIFRFTPRFTSSRAPISAHLCLGGTGAFDTGGEPGASTCNGVTQVTTATVTASVCVHSPGQTEFVPDPTGQGPGSFRTITGGHFRPGYTSTKSGRATFVAGTRKTVLAGNKASQTFNKPSGATSHTVFGAAVRNDDIGGKISLGVSKR